MLDEVKEHLACIKNSGYDNLKYNLTLDCSYSNLLGGMEEIFKIVKRKQ